MKNAKNRGLTPFPDITVIDFEGSGAVEGYPDEPWQVGLVRLSNGRVAADGFFTSLLRVGARPFSPHAPGEHHRRRAEIAAAPSLRDLWPELRPWLSGRPLAAHNAATERKYLRQAAPLHRFGPWIDTLKLSRWADPEEESHTLEICIERLGLKDRLQTLCPNLAPHDALYDAVASGLLLEHWLALPGWERVSLSDLAAARPLSYHRLRARRGRGGKGGGTR